MSSSPHLIVLGRKKNRKENYILRAERQLTTSNPLPDDGDEERGGGLDEGMTRPDGTKWPEGDDDKE